MVSVTLARYKTMKSAYVAAGKVVFFMSLDLVCVGEPWASGRLYIAEVVAARAAG
jgi:hypothetical protein